MPRLDGAIEALFKDKASELVLETGAPVRLYEGGSPGKVVINLPLSSPQIVGAVSEVVPSDMKDGFPCPQLVFPYAAPSGPVLIRFESQGERVRVAVTPYRPHGSPAPRGSGLDERSLFLDLGSEKPVETPVRRAASPFDGSSGVDEDLFDGAPLDMEALAQETRAAAAAVHDEGMEEIDPVEQDEELELASPADMLEFAAQAANWDSGPSSTEATEKPAPRGKPPKPSKKPSRPPARAQRARAAAAVPEEAAEAVEPPAPAPKPAQKPAPKPAPMRPVSPDALLRMRQLLTIMLESRASDLHLSSNSPPMMRVDGGMTAIEGWPSLTPAQIEAMLWSIAPEKNRAQYQELKDTDFAHEEAAARFRVNVFADRFGIGAVLRQIPTEIRSAEDLGLSRAIVDLCWLTKGLVLVTGPTGSGKSTTLAALIDYINRNRDDHIITIEDPIELVHPNKRCLVNQREVGTHTSSFKQALRAALRQDPDVILVGELRDLETIAIAIETAETGHLVFGTLHTNTAASTVDRIIDQFPADRQSQIRMMLAESLKGVISQTLCKKIGGGRAAALEILLVTSSISNLIREGKTYQIPSIMQTARAQGMTLLNDALFDLVKRKLVEPKEAYTKAIAKGELRGMFERVGIRLEGEKSPPPEKAPGT